MALSLEGLRRELVKAAGDGDAKQVALLIRESGRQHQENGVVTSSSSGSSSSSSSSSEIDSTKSATAAPDTPTHDSRNGSNSNNSSIASPINAAFLAAAGKGHVQVMEILYEAGASEAPIALEDAWTSLMDLALLRAVRAGQAEAVSWLTAARASHAASSGVACGIRNLLAVQCRAEHAVFTTGELLSMAAVRGHESVVRLFADNVEDMTVAFGRAVVRDNYIAAKTLLTAGCGFDLRDSVGRTPLMKAAGSGSLEVALLLLECGADVHARDKHGCTVLMKAAACTRSALTRLMLEWGAKVNTKDSFGTTALMRAVRGARVAAVTMLLEHGAHVNAQDNAGRTALMTAPIGGNQDIARALLSYGADYALRDYEGLTAVEIAEWQGLPKFFKGM